MKKFNKKGFTLIEMLVVIAIIAVLVSIVIPTVNGSTEKAREAADAANIRAYIAEVTTEGLTSGEAKTREYTLTQTGEWESIDEIGGIKKASLPKSGAVIIKYDPAATPNVSVTAKA